MKSFLLQPRRSAFSCLLGGVFLLGTVSGLRAGDWQSLLGNTPFGQAAASSAGASGDLEFRGVVQEEGVYLVNLYNPATKTSQWIQVNGKVPGLEVKSYDAAADKLQVTQGGRSLTLPLKQAKVSLLAGAPAAGADAKGDKPDGAADNKDDRRAQIRDMIRARMEGGGGMGNMPPEAQAMIDEFRRRRAEANGGQGGTGGTGDQPRRRNQ